MSISAIGEQCTGCRSCFYSCPKKAIKMTLDDYGYEYPKVIVDLCVECGLCEKVCPAIHFESSSKCLKCGAAYALDSQTKFDGSSGGLFGVFAQTIIHMGGVVFGAAFDNNLKLKTTCAETIEELVPLYKSKYLLSDTNNQFHRIKEELRKGRNVLYCASPCQISALKLFLRSDYKNLFLIDFVCHGVGPQSLFDKSVSYTEQFLKGKIKNFSFRYKKRNSASSHYYSLNFENRGIIKNKEGIYMKFPYYYAYHKGVIYRDSCHECKYASEQRQGDITIGDFHTIEQYDKTIDRFAGISMFVCNTTKGLDMLKNLSRELHIVEMPWEILKNNNRFGGIEKKRPLRTAFRQSLRNDDFITTVEKYLNYKKDYHYYYYMCPKFIRVLGLKLLRR